MKARTTEAGAEAMPPAEVRALKARLSEIRKAHGRAWHLCRDCNKWYGAEDDEYGPCMYKHMRGDPRYVTPGDHECDEPQELRARGFL